MHSQAAKRGQLDKLCVAIENKIDAFAGQKLIALSKFGFGVAGIVADSFLQSAILFDKLKMRSAVGPEGGRVGDN
jgi:hypothetical protein